LGRQRAQYAKQEKPFEQTGVDEQTQPEVVPQGAGERTCERTGVSNKRPQRSSL